MYSVKQAAELLHLTEHTIRYYTDQGLVPHMKRDKNNNCEEKMETYLNILQGAHSGNVNSVNKQAESFK